jgi:geranylgeranyl reductase
MSARAPQYNVPCYDVIVVGGGPAGATAARSLALSGRSVLLLERGGRIKPCGGAIPPRLISDFDIPEHLLVAHVRGARIISPSARFADMPIGGGFVGMVDRENFDEWLRARAEAAGATRLCGRFEQLGRDADGTTLVEGFTTTKNETERPFSLRTRCVIGADGARSTVARQAIPGASRMRYVFAYHEIVRSPRDADFDGERCDVYYRGTLSPDFYGWVFPHGDTTSVGLGSAQKGFGLRQATTALRVAAGLSGAQTLRREGAPIPLKPLRRWDNGRDVLLAGDAAGVVAPASGEGLYYAMTGGALAADAVEAFCATGDARELRRARRRFMRAHGQVFAILGIMQRFWYSNDGRRERFVSICRDPDVQQLTWAAYMTKELVRAKPIAHVRIFFKNILHLTGVLST